MKIAALTLMLLSVAAGPALAQALQKDTALCKDHALFTRMPDSWIHSCNEKTFAAHEFMVGANQKTSVEGHFTKISYYPQATAKIKPSELQILRNFENAVTQVGGSSVFATKNRETFKIVRDGAEYWVDLTAEFTGKYGLTIVKKQAMVQDIVANAEALNAGIMATGHVTVEGIYFDTGKATLKPESAKAIAEVARMLAADPALKVHVVGHTDNAGSVESNMKLSQDRAEAVLLSLVKTHAVPVASLRSFGAGPYAPVSSNDTDAGRTRNRRVELVKQ